MTAHVELCARVKLFATLNHSQMYVLLVMKHGLSNMMSCQMC